MQMNKHNYLHLNTCAKLSLTISWLLGILLGLYLSLSLTEDSYSLVRTLFNSRVSTVGHITSLLLPVILSAIAWKLELPALYLFLAFTKALCYGFCICSLGYVFQGAGWLLRWLYLFSDSCSSALLLWFWHRNMSLPNHRSAKDLYISGITTIAIVLIDMYYVIPFSNGLF